jgi:hypothetical protein
VIALAVANSSPSSDESAASRRAWLVYVVPFAVYMLLNSLEPARPTAAKPVEHRAAAEGKSEPAAGWFGRRIEYRHYPVVYTLKIAVTGIILLALFRDIAAAATWRVNPLAILVGAVGVVLWVGITELGLEARLFEPLGLGRFIASGARSAYNPLAELADRTLLAYGFLAVRFLGLVVVVPIIEEYFLRGFVMRFFTDPKWWTISLTSVSASAIAWGTAAAVAMHPVELFAELAWFSAVTWLMLRGGNLADCVLAHGVTNLLLGIYVLASGKWDYL